MCKKKIFDPAKSTEVSPEGNFKDSITRKRWLGREGELKEWDLGRRQPMDPGDFKFKKKSDARRTV